MQRSALFRTWIVNQLPVALALLACLFTVSCTLPVTFARTTTAPPNAYDRRLQVQLERKMQAMHVPGAIIVVHSTRTGDWTTGLGVSNLASHEPMRPGLHMRIGSITKTLTGTVILQLVEQNRLKLADPVAKFEPEVPDGAHITIRELLDMRSGLYNYSEDQTFASSVITHPETVWTPQELLAIARAHPPYIAPGRGYHYSNTNYILLGMIIEKITGRTLEQVFLQRIFGPLGMKNTLFPARTSAALPTPYSQGYFWQPSARHSPAPDENVLNATHWNPSWGWAAGAAISTDHDLAIWARALATGRLLSPALQKERLTWASTVSPDLRYGLAIADFRGFIGHNGALPGYQSFVGYQPEKQQLVIVLTNLQDAPDGSQTADTLARLIINDLA